MSELSDSPIWQVLWNHAEGDELLEYEQFVQRYTDLKADRDRLRKALLRISLLRPDEGYGVMDISIFAKNALEGKP